MNKWRIAVVLVLFLGPFVFLASFGGYALWQRGWSFWAWWPMTASIALAYVLGAYWQKKRKLLHIEFSPEIHWTDRDKQAWKLVEARAKEGSKIPSDKLIQFDFYSETGQAMALEIGRFYHPGAKEPLASLTLPEILAVVELASHDLAEMVDKYLPGGHLMTISDWMKAKQVSDVYQTASTLWWAASALFSPVDTAMRLIASQVGVSRPFAMLQQNLLLWFYTAYLQRLGTYLIDLNSGRLRVGATRYREILNQQKSAADATEADAKTESDGGHRTNDEDTTEVLQLEKPENLNRVAIGLLGQVKAGKSSLANALLGDQRAKTSVLPQTNEVTRYVLHPAEIPTQLEILDTVGYGHAGPREDQLASTRNAAKSCDVLLLVLHARNAARQADLLLLRDLRKWFDSHPELKMPRVLGVLTHIDLLSPAMEWQPPYSWEQPVRIKEQQIAEAMRTVKELLGECLVGVVPVCAAEGRVYGVNEWLLPGLVKLLDEGRAVAMLRCLKAEVDNKKVRKVFDQLMAAGKQGASILWEVVKR
jgi:predicted GTPase